MTTALFRVIAAGPHVTIQDGGRHGLMRFGVPASGPMDRTAFALANAALGNPTDHPVIDISRGGLTLACEAGRITLALAGGGFIAETPAGRQGSWQVFTLSAGDRLSVRPGPWGSWCCLAFAGLIEAPLWLGSRSTHGPSSLGGGVLRQGQTLSISDATERPTREGPIPCPIWARPRHRLRCVAGPQDRFFPPAAMAAFVSEPFTVTDAADRMGQRLSGPSIAPEGALSIPSEPILRGAVQVSGDGVPTVLLSDHQTTGGYPKIATVIGPDIDGFVQCRPRDRVAFSFVSPEDAVAIARRAAQDLSAMTDRLSRRGAMA